jgi:hypothetical protein
MCCGVIATPAGRFATERIIKAFPVAGARRTKPLQWFVPENLDQVDGGSRLCA